MHERVVVITSAFDVAGTFCLPEDASAAGPVSAMLLIGGSGADTRDGDLTVLTGVGVTAPGTLRHIAHHLADHGVASLRWDRRGFGRSGGDPNTADYHTDLEDAVACHRWLCSQPEVESRRIGVAGHSAGALVACRVCRDIPEVAGAALLGALASPIEDMLRWNVGRARGHWDDLAPKEQAWLIRELPGQLLRSDGLELMLEAARRGDDEILLTGHGLSITVRLARVRQDLATSYVDEFQHVACPALILHGGDDLNVPVGDALTSYQALRRAGNDRVQLAILPGLEHYFVPTHPDPARRIWERLSLEALRQRPMARSAVDVIATWAKWALSRGRTA